MRILILSGFLGSGKTTLLLPLARYAVANAPQKEGPTLVIIENEIGQEGVDDKVLATAGYDVRSMFSGCVCCSLAGNLVDCIRDLGATLNPDWVIIEATGLAYPDSIAKTITTYTDCGVTIATVVDAKRWELLSKAIEPLAKGQAAAAQTLLLTKVDLVEPQEADRVEKQLSQINPAAKLHRVNGLRGVDEEVWKELLYGKA